MHIPKCLAWVMFALAFGCGQTLAAGEMADSTDYRYGVRITAAAPHQDFQDVMSRTGFGAGLYAETNMESGWIAQARFDYINYPQVNYPANAVIAGYSGAVPALTLSADSVALGVDFRHSLPTIQLRQFFVLAGAMGIRYEAEASFPNTQLDQNGVPLTGVTHIKNKTSVKIGLSFGLGCEIYRGLALTERYTTVDINGFSFATLETSLSYRF